MEKKKRFSPQLGDKTWEWPGNKAGTILFLMCLWDFGPPHEQLYLHIFHIQCGRNHRWFHCICAWMTSLCLKHCILVKDRAHICFVVAPDTPVPTQRCPKWKFSIVWRFKHDDWAMWWRLLRISATLAENVNFWLLSDRLMSSEVKYNFTEISSICKNVHFLILALRQFRIGTLLL